MNDEPITTTEDGNPDVHGYPGEVNVDPAFEHLLAARDKDEVPF